MASAPVRIGNLEINQDLDVQRKIWTVQRIGWGGMALIILAALAGLFGSGPLARTEATNAQQSFWLLYDRFGRYEGESVLQLVLTPETIKTNRVTVEIDRTYWTCHAIEQIAPEPIVSSTGSEGFLYTFNIETIDRSTTPAIIIVRLRPECVGALKGHIRVDDQSLVTFQQFIFP